APAPGPTPPEDTPEEDTPEEDTPEEDTPQDGWAWGPMARKLHTLRKQVWNMSNIIARMGRITKGRWKAWDRERNLASSLQEEITMLKRQNEQTKKAIKMARKRLRDDQNKVLADAERRGRRAKVKSAEEILKEWGIK
ncbi:MAG: hypothetical protein ACO3YV_04520, partial [Pelagibacteraceae bacterium]